MQIEIRCECGALLRIKSDKAGLRIKCPQCQRFGTAPPIEEFEPLTNSTATDAIFPQVPEAPEKARLAIEEPQTTGEAPQQARRSIVPAGLAAIALLLGAVAWIAMATSTNSQLPQGLGAAGGLIALVGLIYVLATKQRGGVLLLVGMLACVGPFLFSNSGQEETQQPATSNVAAEIAKPKPGDSRSLEPETASEKALPADAAIELVGDWKFTKRKQFMYVEGEIRNVSNRVVAQAEVTATFLSSEGLVVTTESCRAVYGDLLPGQSSPFKIIAEHETDAETVELALNWRYAI